MAGGGGLGGMNDAHLIRIMITSLIVAFISGIVGATIDLIFNWRYARHVFIPIIGICIFVSIAIMLRLLWGE